MHGWCRLPSPHFNATEEIAIRELIKARTPEELIALLSAVATAILAVIIVMMLYFGREIIIPIVLAILACSPRPATLLHPF